MRLYDLFEASVPDHLEPGQEAHLDAEAPGYFQAQIDDLKTKIANRQRLVKLYKQRIQAGVDVKDSQVMVNANQKNIKDLQDRIKKLKSMPASWSKLTNLLYYITQNCSEFLQEVNKSKHFLYRGLTRDPVSAFAGHSRQDRQTRDSQEICQTLFDQCLKALGSTALRSNSIFVISRLIHASSYGDVYLIFPLDGKYTFTYTNRTDLTMDTLNDVITDPALWTKKLMKAVAASPQINQEEKKQYIQILQKPDNDANDIQRITERLRDLLPGSDLSPVISLKDFRKEFKPSTKNLGSAMKAEREIYINGQYIAIHQSMEQQIRNYFRQKKIII